MKTAYEKINLHMKVTFKLSDGSSMNGEVVGIDSCWITLCMSGEKWCIAKAAIVAFCVHEYEDESNPFI